MGVMKRLSLFISFSIPSMSGNKNILQCLQSLAWRTLLFSTISRIGFEKNIQHWSSKHHSETGREDEKLYLDTSKGAYTLKQIQNKGNIRD